MIKEACLGSGSCQWGWHPFDVKESAGTRLIRFVFLSPRGAAISILISVSILCLFFILLLRLRLCLYLHFLFFIFLKRAFLAACASAGVVTVAGCFRFAAKCFEFVPRLDVIFSEGFACALAFGVFDEHNDLVAHRQDVNDLALALGRDNSFVAFGELFAGFHILLIFIDETATQTAAHAGDFFGGE